MTTTINYVFLHGGGQGSWVWDETVAALHQQSGSQPIRTLVLDIPGCGIKRGRDIEALGVDEVADELLSEMVRADVQDIVLVGHSQAGTMLPRMAEKQPQLFRRLIYLSCSAPLPGQSILQMMGSSQHGMSEDEVGFPLDPKLHRHREQYPLMFCNDMSADEAAAFLGKLGHDMWPMPVTLATDWRYEHLVSLPSSYVVCLRDGILPVPWQERFLQRLNAERLIRIDAGHQAMNTQPRVLAGILRQDASNSVSRRTLCDR